MIRDKVIEAIADLSDKKISLLTPKVAEHGDYAFHVSQLGDPQKITESITTLSKNPLFEKVEQVGPFINLFISAEILSKELATILSAKDDYGKEPNKAPQRINLEFGQPNTHKLPHIGHLFSYIYGESLARLLDFTGNHVYRTNYQGDVGLHVAKCLYIVTRDSLLVAGLKTLEEKVNFLQKCYQEGSRLYEEDETAKKEIDELNKKIYDRNPTVILLWEQTREWSIEFYKEFEKLLGTTYDRYYFESETSEPGMKIVQENIGKVFERSDGAVVFKGEKYGLHTRVFITSHDTPTYEGKDIGLISLKQKEWPFDKALITTASEQTPYWQVVKKAIELIFPDLERKITHIGFGMIDLKGGKMSSRTGNIVSATDLVKSVVESVKKPTNNEKRAASPTQVIAQIVGLAAIKYSFLRSEANKNKIFDIQESVATAGNSGPYLLYAYARCMSVLSKSSPLVILTKVGIQRTNMDPRPASPERLRGESESGMTETVQNEELALLRSLFRFPEVVTDAAENLAPHLLCTYLFDIAQKYSIFYETCPILKASGTTRDFRLNLTGAVAQVLKNGLSLLGISVLDKI